jgi:nicotinamide riboside transporter PnuC
MDIFTIFTWALTAITIFGTYLNAKQNQYGFIVWGICNMLWLGVDFTRGIYAQAALYVVFIGFNIYGWIQWKKKELSK